ncbi:hypothetical protein bcgnr5369_14620 [Bacillus cereus]
MSFHPKIKFNDTIIEIEYFKKIIQPKENYYGNDYIYGISEKSFNGGRTSKFEDDL